MGNQDLNASDRERFVAARALGNSQARDASAVVRATYDRAVDAVRLVFRGGGSMSIPRRLVPGLARQPVSKLRRIAVSPAGDALRWPSIDADVYIPGLVEQAFGQRLFAAAAGRRGGLRKTRSKAAAARRNGAKGGRPRKQPSA
jgi:hypothetical protein